ncbi:MAG TPA: FAD binding domain-containing protein [Actinomycetota bacterium]|nr:FAD binding domain-containing protein [Actinomycetota bacterium]
MEVLLPRTLEEALEIAASNPGVVPIAGGSDVMVELNMDLAHPETLMDVSRLPELREIRRENGSLFLGSGVTYTRIMRELPGHTALVQASRSVGSPQIRNRGTVGGNLGTASPAGDALPVLAAWGAEVVLGRAGGSTRSLPWREFVTGVKRTAREPGELILGARWSVPRGPGSFSKIGTRNAMVIAVANLCLQLDEPTRSVRVALGSVAPTVVRAEAAEAFAAQALQDSGLWDDPRVHLGPDVIERFGELVAEAADPIDDVRGTSVYRRHAVEVMARRALGWALADRAAG